MNAPARPLTRSIPSALLAFLIGAASLHAQTVPAITLAIPFSPGGFNNIGSATATSIFYTQGGVLTIEVDPSTPQVIDVMSSYTATSNANLPINFSFLNVDRGIPTTFFGQKWNFLNGGPLAQFQSGHFGLNLSITGAPNLIAVLDIGSDVYSQSVRFWLNTQTNILDGKYYPNGVPVPQTSATPGTASGGNVPKDPSTGKVYASNLNPDKPLNTNVYRASGLSDHIANNDVTSNEDFNSVLSIVSLLPTAAQTESSFHQVIAEPYASMLSVALESMDRFRQAALAGAGTDDIPRQRIYKTPEPGAKASVIEEFEITPWSVFTDVSNTQASLDGTSSGLSDFDYSILQSILGVEYAFTPSLTGGAIFGYGRSTLYNFEYADVDLTSDNFSAALFGTWRPGRFSFTGLLGYTCFSYQSTRQINFGTPQAGFVDRTANADWVAHGLTSAIEATYTWSLGPVNFVPEAMLATAWQFQPGFTESGADSLDLALAPSTVGSLIFGLGVGMEVPIKISNSIVLTPKIRAAWEHDFLGDEGQDHEVDATFANVPEPGSLTVLGQNRGSDELSLSGALEWRSMTDGCSSAASSGPTGATAPRSPTAEASATPGKLFLPSSDFRGGAVGLIVAAGGGFLVGSAVGRLTVRIAPRFVAAAVVIAAVMVVAAIIRPALVPVGPALVAAARIGASAGVVPVRRVLVRPVVVVAGSGTRKNHIQGIAGNDAGRQAQRGEAGDEEEVLFHARRLRGPRPATNGVFPVRGSQKITA